MPGLWPGQGLSRTLQLRLKPPAGLAQHFAGALHGFGGTGDRQERHVEGTRHLLGALADLLQRLSVPLHRDESAAARAQSRHVRRLPFHHRLAVFVSGFLPHVGHHQDERLGLFTSISISRIQLAE